MTLEEEKKFLDGELKDIKERKAVMLLAFVGDKIIGIPAIKSKEGEASAHVAGLGISVAKDFRGEGIGKLLMQLVLDEAIKHISNLQIVILSVFDNNVPARSLYEKVGFKEYGRLPEGLLRAGEHREEIYMYKKVR